MRQLALELAVLPQPGFANFVPGRNAELLAALQAMAWGRSVERFIYIWGMPGSGRSHLLRSAVTAAACDPARGAAYVPASRARAQLDECAADALLAVDDVERLDTAGAAALFALYNRMREGGGALIASGAAAPAGLGLRSDLATRLGWGLVYEVHALSDDEKARAMSARAQARGYTLPGEVCDYVLRHGRRDLPHLLAIVDLLDRYSLETRRAVTLPLAREVLRSSNHERSME